MSTFSNPLTEYSPQLELEDAWPKPADGESEHGLFDEHQEMEQAIALLEVANEEQLDRVLGALIQKANSELGNAVSPPVGLAIAGVLKTVAGDVLPLQERRSDNGLAVASGHNLAVDWPPSRDRHWGSSWRASAARTASSRRSGSSSGSPPRRWRTPRASPPP